MMIGWGGNNGSTLSATILANRHNIITLLPLPHDPRIRHLRLRKRRTQCRILDP